MEKSYDEDVFLESEVSKLGEGIQSSEIMATQVGRRQQALQWNGILRTPASNPGPTIYCCVALGKVLNVSELQFPLL